MPLTSGMGFEDGRLKICSNKDGSRVWTEVSGGNDFVMTVHERSMLRDVAKHMGARIIDPDGIYRNSVRLEYDADRSLIRSSAERNREFGISESYIQKSTREDIEYTDREEREELDALG